MIRWLVTVALALAHLAFAEASLAKAVPTCKSPRNAVDSVFAWQAGKQQSLANATKCFEHGGRTQKQLEDAARRLKTLFDAEGVLVQVDKLSDDADYLDADKNTRLIVTPRYPEVAVEKRDGKWIWTRESLDWIEERYDDRLGDLDRLIDAIPDPLLRTYGGLALWQYAAFALLLLAGVGASLLFRRLVGGWLRRLEHGSDGGPGVGRRWLDRIAFPTGVVASALVVRVLYPELRLPVGVAAALHVGLRLTLTLAAIVVAFRFADVVSEGLAHRAESEDSRLDQHLVPILRKSMKGVTLSVGALLVLHGLNVDVTALFATLGIGTLAIGLAAKDTLANLLGSISIFIDNPFKIGDLILVEGVEGIVEEVGFRSTRIRTPHQSIVVLPNAKLADAKIDNYGHRGFKRCMFVVHVVHGTPAARCEELCAAIRKVLAAHPAVADDRTKVVLSSIAAPAIEISVTFFLSDVELDDVEEKHRVLVAVLDQVRSLGVVLHAPPTAAPPPVKAS